MDYRTYASPFSWRYGRAALRALFSERTRRRLWRAAWVALAEAQSAEGLVDDGGTRRPASARRRQSTSKRRLPSSARFTTISWPRFAFSPRKLRSAAENSTSAPRRWTSRTPSRRTGSDWPVVDRAEPRRIACARSPNAVRQYADLVCMGSRICSRPNRRLWDTGSPSTPKIFSSTMRICGSSSKTSRPRVCAGRSGRPPRTSGSLDGSGRSANSRPSCSSSLALRHARSVRKPIPGSSTISCSQPWPASARRCRSSPPTYAYSAALSSAKPANRSAAPRSGVRRCRSSAIRSCASVSTHWRACCSVTGDSRGRTPRRTSWNARSTIAQIAATILPEALICSDEIIALAQRVVEGLRVDERRIAQNLRTYGPFSEPKR